MLRTIFTTLLLLPLFAFSQVTSRFYKTFEGGDVEYGYSVKQANDGGFILSGMIGFGPGGTDAVLLKMGADGSQQWNMAFGGASGEEARDVLVESDGYLWVGSTRSFGAGLNDALIVRTDLNGAVQWARTLGGTANDYAMSVTRASDGGYVLGGYTYSFGVGNADFYAAKFNASGTLQWTRTIGGTAADFCQKIDATSDGGYLLSGYTFSFGGGSTDYYLVKLNSSGLVVWNRTYGNAGSEIGYRGIEGPDGNYYITGYTSAMGAGGSDALIVKVNTLGSQIWAMTFGGANMDRGFHLANTSSGRILISGETTTATFGAGDEALARIDVNGNLEWSYHYGTPNDETGFGVSAETNDGGFALASWEDSNEDIMILKADSLGEAGCNRGTLNWSVISQTLGSVSAGFNGTGGSVSSITLPFSISPLTEIVRCASVLDRIEVGLEGEARPGMANLSWNNSRDFRLVRVLRSENGEDFAPVSAWLDATFERSYADGGFGPEAWYKLELSGNDGEILDSEVLFLAAAQPNVPQIASSPEGLSLRLPEAIGSWSLTDLLGRVWKSGYSSGSAETLEFYSPPPVLVLRWQGPKGNGSQVHYFNSSNRSSARWR